MTVKMNLRPFLKLKDMMTLRSPIRKIIFKQWAFVYRVFVHRRFTRYSRGGGDWPPLKKSTVAGRKVGKRAGQIGRRVSILWDTGKLIDAVDPKMSRPPGSLERIFSEGVEVGFGGPARHPKGRATIADIARFHDAGEGNLPERKIIADPDHKTMRKMADIVIMHTRRITK